MNSYYKIFYWIINNNEYNHKKVREILLHDCMVFIYMYIDSICLFLKEMCGNDEISKFGKSNNKLWSLYFIFNVIAQ